jgi:hypothetical protein
MMVWDDRTSLSVFDAAFMGFMATYDEQCRKWFEGNAPKVKCKVVNRVGHPSLSALESATAATCFSHHQVRTPQPRLAERRCPSTRQRDCGYVLLGPSGARRAHNWLSRVLGDCCLRPDSTSMLTWLPRTSPRAPLRCTWPAAQCCAIATCSHLLCRRPSSATSRPPPATAAAARAAPAAARLQPSSVALTSPRAATTMATSACSMSTGAGRAKTTGIRRAASLLSAGACPVVLQLLCARVLQRGASVRRPRRHSWSDFALLITLPPSRHRNRTHWRAQLQPSFSTTLQPCCTSACLAHCQPEQTNSLALAQPAGRLYHQAAGRHAAAAAVAGHPLPHQRPCRARRRGELRGAVRAVRSSSCCSCVESCLRTACCVRAL